MTTDIKLQFSFTEEDVEKAIQNFDTKILEEYFKEASNKIFDIVNKMTNGFGFKHDFAKHLLRYGIVSNNLYNVDINCISVYKDRNIIIFNLYSNLFDNRLETCSITPSKLADTQWWITECKSAIFEYRRMLKTKIQEYEEILNKIPNIDF